MAREHGEVKLMRTTFSNEWYAVRESGGIVTDRWPLDANSVEQLEKMRDANLREIARTISSSQCLCVRPLDGPVQEVDYCPLHGVQDD